MADADRRAPKRWTRRPLYSPNQMLTADQLNLMMEEEHSRTQKLMRGLHGHGVIFGLAVTREEEPTPLKVSCGMALDPHGRLLYWSGGAVTPDDMVSRPDCEGLFTLSIHYARREVPGSGCGPCSDQPHWIEEGVIYSLRHERRDECQPIDRDCVRPGEACIDEEASCIGLEEYVCLRNGSGKGALPPAADVEWGCSQPGALTRIGCSDISYDPDAGIPVACVEVRNVCENPKCEPRWGFGEVRETCAVRPWVYRTPLLYELIKGCQNDLARVEAVRWGAERTSSGDGWPDEVPWEEFGESLRHGVEVDFSKHVRADTVHPGSVFLTAILWERQADYMLTRRIPASLQPLDADNGYARKFRLRVNPDWIRNEIDTRSELRSGGRVELTIRGQMVLDRCDNMLDALPLHYAPSTPPKSRPGGDFVTLLRFAAETRAPSPPPEPEPEASPSDEVF
jgi:hypothetical protein